MVLQQEFSVQAIPLQLAICFSVVKRGHTRIPGLWMQVLDAGLWTLGSGLLCGLYTEGAGCMDKVKLLHAHFTRHRCFPVKFAKFLRTSLGTPTIL